MDWKSGQGQQDLGADKNGGQQHHHEYTIGGVKVHFPAKAYPSQVAMMSKVIAALDRSQHSLLESPTGSGKSLALLCSALAWQKRQRELVEAYNAALDDGLIDPEEANAGGFGDDMEVPDEDFVRGIDSNGGFFVPADSTVQTEADGQVDRSGGVAQGKARRKKQVPKIYFGTRTHKQISQIVRELKKTRYSDVRMSILASRDHTCIHPGVSRAKNRTEACKELNDFQRQRREGGGGGCLYLSNVKSKLYSHYQLYSYRGGSREAWDLEDMVKVGKKVRVCPYFVTRELKDASDIVFCPYNYLVEPLIRKSLEIKLEGQVVILDEAHNIEDSAREAVSWLVSQESLREALGDIEKYLKYGVSDKESHEVMGSVCSKLSLWMDSHRSNLSDYQEFNSESKVWNGTEIAAEFSLSGLGAEHFAGLRKAFDKVMAEWAAANNPDRDEAERELAMVDLNSSNNSDQLLRLSSATVTVLEGFFMVLHYLYMEDMKFRDDFRVALVKTQARRGGGGGPRSTSLTSDWMGKAEGLTSSSSSSSVFSTTLTANFWCLNPAVCFEDLKKTVRSIVLTSGTLSPMASFSSELDVRFPIQLEANHVIDKSQVWVGTLGRGPTGHCLNATYRHVESFDFQDEVGRLVLQVCRKVPHGVLLFLPSYRMLAKLSDRWRQTGLWDDLSERKVIISEPRFSDEFESAIRHYYEVIEMSSSSSTSAEDSSSGGGVDGALFMAVCRGKVSEGLDFADTNARAVICVGIPFPNVKDIKVDLKKKYNDIRKVNNKDILTGNQWYEIQAFRALNQALGRCIRHRNDWGAILMVDDRFASGSRYVQSLSKWVRSQVVHYPNCDAMLPRLEEFIAEMSKRPIIQISKVFQKDHPTGSSSFNPEAAAAAAFPAGQPGVPQVTNEVNPGGGGRWKKQRPREGHRDTTTETYPEVGRTGSLGISRYFQQASTSGSSSRSRTDFQTTRFEGRQPPGPSARSGKRFCFDPVRQEADQQADPPVLIDLEDYDETENEEALIMESILDAQVVESDSAAPASGSVPARAPGGTRRSGNSRRDLVSKRYVPCGNHRSVIQYDSDDDFQ